MDIPIVLAEKIAASAAIGLLIGLEREWAHKDTGVRSFAIAALLGTLSWLVSPTLAFVQMSVVLIVIVLVNVFNLRKDEPLEITTSLALAATNVMGILVGGGSFFLAFTCAIVIAALLSWKSELVSFTSKLTIPEIRGTLLMIFITAVVYPLLPEGYIDPWKIINPRSIWLTVIIDSALSFVNYVLLRQLGMKGMRYSAILGGLVNSAATSALLGEELKVSPEFAAAAPSDFLLADLAMILRNGVLVAIFSWAAGLQATIAVAIVLGPMLLMSIILSIIIFIRASHKTQPPSQKPPLTSPLALRSVLSFSLLFFSLTVVSGLAQRFFGAIGFLAVVVLGALASAASSSVLVGTQVRLHMLTANPAAIAIYFASVVGLIENVAIFYSVTRNRPICLQLALYSLLIVLAGGVAVGLVAFLGW
ncbi:MAG: DUF4010 domain-containing protein [Ktedonobacteraceae bacterium]